MLLRNLFKCFLPLIVLLSNPILGQDCPDDEPALSIVQFNLNSCTSLSNGSFADYGEFKGLSANKSDCVTMSVLGRGGALYRNDPSQNIHSCTPGIDGTEGMCVSSDESCNYQADSDRAIRFDVEVAPGVDLAQLKSLTFYEKAPEQYVWIGGDSGDNNYPTKYGVRVTSEGREIFRSIDLPTGPEWTLQSIDLSFFSGFVVDKPTIFSFELVAYCPIDNGAEISVWDIDHIRLYGGCISSINGGMISTDDGFSVNTCTGDGIRDLIDPKMEFDKGENSDWLITDVDGNIIDLPVSPPFEFENAGEGVCLIYSISYDGRIRGLEIGSNIDDLEGCYDLSNAITVNRQGVGSSTIFIENGNDEVTDITLCTNDGNDDIVNVGSRGGDENSALKDWVITNQSGEIINADATPPFNFEGVDGGTCLIWQVSYVEGLEGKAVGENIADLSGCFTVSNSLTVIRNQPLGGTISFASSSEDELEICSGDGLADEFRFRITGDQGANSYWVITSINDRIIAVVDDPIFDFEEGRVGTYLIRHISTYEDITGLAIDNSLSDITGCYSVSNVLTIDRNSVDAGSITTSNGLTETGICIESGGSNIIDVDLVENRNIRANSAWVITDEAGEIEDLPNNPPFDFTDSDGGVSLIWHLSYLDVDGLEIGENANDLEGCFDFSEPIVVNKGVAVGGTITGGPYLFCVGDGMANFIPRGDISIGGASGTNSRWIITDDRGQILDLPSRPSNVNFDEAPEGICLVWHISYEEGLDGLEVGNNALRDLEGCFGLSNSIEVTRTSVVGGELVGGPFGFCVGDGIIDTIVREDLELFGWRGSNRIWFVTDIDGNILSTVVRPSLVNFDEAPVGTCLIYHGSYEGEIEGAEIGSNVRNITGCFDLSNPVTVNRGGTQDIVIEGGPFAFCVSNGSPDMIPSGAINNNTNSGNGAQWVVTDEDGEILGLPEHPTDVDFDEAGEGTCLIWLINYEGISGLELGNNALTDLDGCYSISNSIEVNRTAANGGELEGGPFSFCVGDGIADRIDEDDVRLFGREGESRSWLITDESGKILDIPANPSDVDFDNAPAGVCLLWHLSYSGEIEGLEVGENANELSGCFDLSNPLTIARGGPSDVVLSGGPFTFCVADGQADRLSSDDISLNVASGAGAQWVITDENGNIIGLPERPTDVNFEEADAGTCFIYFVSFAGEVTGLVLEEDIDDLDGCLSVSNPITVNRNTGNGGELTGGPFNFCIGDGEDDFINDDDLVLTGSSGDSRRWIVTDASGIILSLPVRPSLVNFEDAGSGTCLIWHIGYSGDIEGLEEGANAFNLNGCHSISNPISVFRLDPDGGTLTGGPFEFCVGDDNADNIPVNAITITGSEGSNSQWIVTDEDGDILGLPESPSDVNFEEADGGTCFIWSVSYEGDIEGLENGNNINTDLDGCLHISNSVAVIRNVAVGGALTGGPFSFCVGDGEDDFIDEDDIVLSGNAGDNSRWIVTDQEGNILSIPVNPSLVNFDEAESGTCLIWHIGFSGAIGGLEVGSNASDLMGCFDLSNSIAVVRTGAEDLSIEGGPFSFCVDDGIADGIDTGEITPNINSSTGVQWVITDDNNLIIGLPENPSEVDFDTAGEGTCFIYLVSFADDLAGLELNNDITSDLEGCFNISNSIEITRSSANGGELTGGPFNICVGDGEDDFISDDNIVLTGNSGESSRWLVTDEAGNILSIPVNPSLVNFEDASTGTCLIWHLGFSGDLTGLEVGQNANNLSGCFDLSNPISVIRSGTDALTIEGGPFSFCVGDDVADVIDLDDVSPNITSETGVQWVVTDDNNQIIGLPGSPSDVDFDTAAEGTCFIYLVSFAGDIVGLELDNDITSDLSGCFNVSNSIAVTRNSAGGGELSGGPFSVCVGDGEDDFISDDSIVLTGSSGENNRWLVTDEAGNILSIPVRPSLVNFEDAGTGTCLIWHVGFSGDLVGLEVGQNANNLSGCFDLSNPISVIRSGSDDITLEGGPFTFCVGNGEADMIADDDLSVVTPSGVGAQWVITDENGEIIGLPTLPSEVNFDDVGEGVCFIYFVSFSGNLLGLEEGNNINADLVGCHSVSNSVAVNRNAAGGGELKGGPFSFCVGDGANDFIGENDIVLEGSSADNTRWLVTDEAGNILSIPIRPSIVNFEDAGTGTCLIWHLGFSGDITGLEVGQNANNLSGCFDLSNSISVVRSGTNEIVLEGGPFTFCVGDDSADRLSENDLSINTPSGAGTQWVITDDNNNIIGLPQSPTEVNFNNVEEGTCFIYFVSFSGDITGLELNNNIDALDGCFSVSNAVSVIRTSADGGELTGGPFNFCVGDGTSDFIGEDDIVLTGRSGDSRRWLITDESGIILNMPVRPSLVNFDEFEGGTCLIWHLSFSGELDDLEEGFNVLDLSGCFDLSEPIPVFRSGVEGGVLTGGPYEFCVMDSEADFVDVVLSGNSGANSQWVITDDQSNIVALPNNIQNFDFDQAEAGICLIWHLSHDNDLEGLVVGNNASALTGCFSFSNSIMVTRNEGEDCIPPCEVEGGVLAGGPFSFCAGDGIIDTVAVGSISLSGADGPNQQWVVTDADGNILGLPSDPSEVDFDGAGAGECLIWSLTFEDGLTGAALGNNANQLEGCFDLSNPISVIRTQIVGGSISGGPFNFCVGDSIPDNILDGEIMLTGNNGSSGQWVVTDESGNILNLPTTPSDVDFDSAPVGICLLWHLSYDGDISGLEVGSNALDLEGCHALSNFIAVNRSQPNGGTILGGPFEFCVGDTIVDNVDVVLMNNSGRNSQWVITDDQGEILDLPSDISEFDFNNAPAGVCLIWHLSFEDGLIGAAIGNNASDLMGCFSLSNSITVTRLAGDDCIPPCEISGGRLSGGPFLFCVGNEIRDTIPSSAITLDSVTGSNQQWVVTDPDGNIIGLPDDPSEIDFDVAGVGECLIWNLSFEDGLSGALIGNNANQLEGCFALSNPISVVRARPQGGTLAPTSFEFCVGDGIVDTISESSINLTNNLGSNFQWVITDAVGTILFLPTNLSEVDFDNAPAGECFVWNLSFEDGLEGASVGNSVNDLVGCFSISNSILVSRSNVLGGNITGGPFEFCVGDSIVDNLPIGSISLSGNLGDSSQWVVTDTLGNILGLPGMPSDVNFEDAPAGECLIWHLSFSGSITGLEMGMNASNISGCFNLSNSISVIRKSGDDCEKPCNAVANTLSGGPFSFCVGDSIADNLAEGSIGLMIGDSLLNSQWVVTDTLGNILGLPDMPSEVNFDDAGAGRCLIWNIAYEDSTTVFTIDANANSLQGCYALSNPVTIIRNQPIGGALTGGPFTFCVGDSIADNIPTDGISLNGNSGNSQWVVTDTLGNILGLPTSPSDVNFDDAPAGVCLVWHLSFIDSIVGAEVGLNANNISGCVSLSNPITVNRNQPNGGVIAGGPFEFCVGDSLADMIPVGAISLTGNVGSNSQWVVTDDLGNILGLPTDPSEVDFENAPEGICFIWHLSFEDGLMGAVVDSSANNLVGCFSLSNSIEVVRNSGDDCPEPCEALANTLSGGPFTFCVGDSIADTLATDAISLIIGDSLLNSQWVVTDTLGNILGLPNSPTEVNFEQAGVGTCLIWNIAYKDSTTVFTVGANANNLSGCIALSNSITVVRNQPNGGVLRGGPFDFCVGDNVSDTIPDDGITLLNNVGSNSQWVLTDTAGIILALPNSPSDVNFDSAGSGTCLIWHLSFEDGLLGAAVGSDADSLIGCFSLSNPITINRTQPNGGTLIGGPFTFCVGDSMQDTIDIADINLGQSDGSVNQWLITNVDRDILFIPDSPGDVNFDELPVGIALLWNISFQPGLQGLNVGSSTDSLVGCFGLSNALNIVLTTGAACEPEVCDVSGGLITGGPFEFCVGDGESDFIPNTAIRLDTAQGQNSQWVVTDSAGVILGLPTNPSSVNFDIAPEGTCQVWHLSYDGVIQFLVIGNSLTDLVGCFDLSNSISVVRVTLEDCPQACSAIAGTIEGGPFDFCAGNGIDDRIPTGSITLTGSIGDRTRWVITDMDNNILGLPADISFANFDEVEPGTSLVRVITINDTISGLEPGNNLSEVTGCFALTNAIDVITSSSPNGGTISGGPFAFCVGDGVADIISETIPLIGSTGDSTQWVITDLDQNIIGVPANINTVDFDGAGVDTCLIWSLSYSGNISGLLIDSLSLSDISGCFGLSNSLPVIRVSGGDCEGVLGQAVINEITDDDRVEIKNIGNAPIDISDYWICNRPFYERINSLTIECGGDFILEPGEVISVVTDVVPISGQDGELGLYKSSLFAFSDEILDYVQWGSNSHGRTTVAIEAGIWTLGESVDPFGFGRSISYDGEGDSSSDWTETDPNLCSENSLVAADPQERLSIKVFPVPANSEVNFELNHEVDEMHKVSIFDNYGHTLMRKELDAQDDFKLNVSDLRAGIYYLKVKTGRYSAVQRFVIVN